jgi:hypothetical protein
MSLKKVRRDSQVETNGSKDPERQEEVQIMKNSSESANESNAMIKA